MAERYLIGHPEERTDELEVMSPQSPLGAALLGKGPDDWVEYQAPRGVLRVKVLEVESQ
jgi:transcription elongation factor GreA